MTKSSEKDVFFTEKEENNKEVKIKKRNKKNKRKTTADKQDNKSSFVEVVLSHRFLYKGVIYNKGDKIKINKDEFEYLKAIGII